jgi:energy-coupling factor transporter transmembrane protein EcfT
MSTVQTRWLARLPGHMILFLGILAVVSVLLYYIFTNMINIFSIIVLAWGTLSIALGVHIVYTR